jgi:hypothetical protein
VLHQDLAAYNQVFRFLSGALPFGTAETMGVTDGYVDFIEAPNNKGFLILRILLHEVKKIHKTMYGFIDINQLSNIGNDAKSKKKLKKIHEELRRIQSSLYVAEKGT